MLTTFMVTSELDDFSGGTLREAIAEANQNPGADEIIFSTDLAHNLDGATITQTNGNGTFFINDSVTITTLDANGDPLFPNGISIDGKLGGDDVVDGDGWSIFDIQLSAGVDKNEAVTLAGLTITGGDTAGDGGAVFFIGSANGAGSSSTLTISDSIIKENHAEGNGGGV